MRRNRKPLRAMFRKLNRTSVWDFLRPDSSSPSRWNWYGAAILFVLVNLTFFPYIWGDRTIQESADETASLYISGSRQHPVVQETALSVLDPGAAAWQDEPFFALSHGEIFNAKEPPIWNPYNSFGTPLAADAESQPYYPLAWIPIIWRNARAYDVFVALRIFVAGLFAFLYLRQFTRFVPALVGGTAFMYTGFCWLYLANPDLSVSALAPAMLYALERVLRRPSFGTAALTSFVIGCAILGGMPELTALVLLFGASYFVARIALDGPLRSGWRSYLPYLALGTCVGIGISSVMVMPFLEYVGVSTNTHSAGGAGLAADPLTWSTTATYLAPLYLGPPVQDIFAKFSGWTTIRGFFGCSALFLAMIGFFSSLADIRRRTAESAVPVVLGIVAILLLAKRFGAGIVNWTGVLPVLRAIVFPKYDEAIIGCCIALLAGFGVARLYEKRVTMLTIVLAAVLPLTVLSVAASENRQAFLQLSEHQNYYTLSLSAALLYLTLVFAAAAASSSGRLKPMYFGGAMLALVVIEPLSTYIIPLRYVVNTPPPQSVSALLGAPYVTYLKSHIGNDRLMAQDGLLYPDWSSAFSLADVRGLAPLYYERYLPFVHAFLTDSGGDYLNTRFVGLGDDMTTVAGQRFLTLSSVRYVATTNDLSRTTAFDKMYDADGIRIFQFRSPLPRVSIYHCVVDASTPEAALHDLRSTTFDPYSEVVVEGKAGFRLCLPGARKSPVIAGRLEEYKPTAVRATVNTDGPSFVVLNDTNFPGWSATIDGRPAQIFAANYLFRGVVVPSGTHVIEYRYSPRSFTVGLTISLISILMVIGMAVFSLIARRNNTAAIESLPSSA